MRFGPYAPREIDCLIPQLTARGVAFDLSFDEKKSKADLSFSPANALALAEFRTRNYTAQYFYFDIDDHVCQRDSELVQLMEQYLHQHSSPIEGASILHDLDEESEGDSTSTNVIELEGSSPHAFRSEVRKLRRLKAILAFIALLAILVYWGLVFWKSLFADS